MHDEEVVLKIHVSLDGYVRATDGDVMGWVFRTYDDELRAWEADLLWQRERTRWDAACTRRWLPTAGFDRGVRGADE